MSAAFSLVTRGGHPDFLDLPWQEPLDSWRDERLVRMARGLSRHVVRFVAYDDRVYALKETSPELARREFRCLRELAEEHLPVVDAVGVVTERRTADNGPLDAVLITRFLDYSLPYRYVFGLGSGPELRSQLIDAGALLVVRLHLEGFYWGDCSLSNVLFRRDAGSLMAYLVDAETAERHQAPLADELRGHDVDVAIENVAGGLLDLQAAGRLQPDFDALELIDELRDRYERLWVELTRTDVVSIDDRHVVEERIRRLNEMGFDVAELGIDASGGSLRVRPVVVEEGHHHRELQRRTGLDVQENQARRLLNDIAAYRAFLECTDPPTTVPNAVAAARWMAEVYEPIVESVPDDLRGRLEPAELFHELLEHRWLRSQAEGREVTNDEALQSYLAGVLPARTVERTILEPED